MIICLSHPAAQAFCWLLALVNFAWVAYRIGVRHGRRQVYRETDPYDAEGKVKA